MARPNDAPSLADNPTGALGAPPLARRGSRCLATAIDVGLVAVLFWWVGTVAPWGPWAPLSDGPWVWRHREALTALGIFAVLNGYLLAARGQTLGKMIMKIRIARPGGSQGSLGRLLGLRYGVPLLMAFLPISGITWLALDALFMFVRPSRQCLHDTLADTLVVTH